MGKKTKKEESKSKNNVKSEIKKQAKNEQVVGEVTAMSGKEKVLFEKYSNELGLNAEVSNILARDEKLSSFYQECLSTLNSPISLANIIVTEVARELKDKEINQLKFTAEQITKLIKILDEGTISSKITKQVFEQMAQSGENPEKIVEDKGLVQISDPAIIGTIIDEVITKNPDNIEKFKAGNKKLLGFFVGQVLKSTSGKANPKVVNQLLAEKLK